MFTTLTFNSRGLVDPWRRMATGAALSLYRDVLVNKRSLLVGVALVADGIPARQRRTCRRDPGPVRVVAVIALNQPLVDPVMKRFGKVRLGRGVASVAQLRLVLDQQMLLFRWRDGENGSPDSQHRHWRGRIPKNAIAPVPGRGNSNSERCSLAATSPRRRISSSCPRRPPHGPPPGHGTLRTLDVKDRPPY